MYYIGNDIYLSVLNAMLFDFIVLFSPQQALLGLN